MKYRINESELSSDEIRAIGKEYFSENFGWKGLLNVTKLSMGILSKGEPTALFTVGDATSSNLFGGSSKKIYISGSTGKVFEYKGVAITDINTVCWDCVNPETKTTILIVKNSKKEYAFYDADGNILIDDWFSNIVYDSRIEKFIVTNTGQYMMVYDFALNECLSGWYRDVTPTSIPGVYVISLYSRSGILKNLIMEGKQGKLLDDNYLRIYIHQGFTSWKPQFISCDGENGDTVLYTPDFKKIDTYGAKYFTVLDKISMPKGNTVYDVWFFEDKTTGKCNLLEESTNELLFKEWVDDIDILENDFFLVVERDKTYNFINVSKSSPLNRRKYELLLNDDEEWFSAYKVIRDLVAGGMVNGVILFIAVKYKGKCNLYSCNYSTDTDVTFDSKPYLEDWCDSIFTMKVDNECNNTIIIENGGKHYLLVSFRRSINRQLNKLIEIDDIWEGYFGNDPRFYDFDCKRTIAIERNGKYNFVKCPDNDGKVVGELMPIWFDYIDGYNTIFPVAWKDDKCTYIDTTTPGACRFLFIDKTTGEPEWFDDADILDPDSDKTDVRVVKDGKDKYINLIDVWKRRR